MSTFKGIQSSFLSSFGDEVCKYKCTCRNGFCVNNFYRFSELVKSGDELGIVDSIFSGCFKGSNVYRGCDVNGSYKNQLLFLSDWFWSLDEKILPFKLKHLIQITFKKKKSIESALGFFLAGNWRPNIEDKKRLTEQIKQYKFFLSEFKEFASPNVPKDDFSWLCARYFYSALMKWRKLFDN